MPRIFRSFAVLLAAVFSLPALVNAAVGYTPGSFNVSPTGAATYSIPIAVPPGAAGMQPSLSLAYSSQGGNGLVGMGFSLQGLSAITRCPKTYATDGTSGGVDLTYNDRYCLDGQRLILVSGTYGYANSEYRTELDTLTRVIAYGAAGNGPAYFTAQTKSGQIIQYGNTADSRIIATGKMTAAVWNANRITDTVGNYMTVTYTQNTSTGEYYPQRIDYAGNASTPTSSSVQFIYATRTDTFTGYVAGSTVSNTQRLTNIQVFEGTNSIRDYRLTYASGSSTGRTHLISLVECPSNDAAAVNCLPGTSFAGWTEGPDSTFAVLQESSHGASGLQDRVSWADVNGDGLADWTRAATDRTQVRVSNGDGTFGSIIISLHGQSGIYDYVSWVDINGDGRADWVRGGGSVIQARLSNGNGTFGPIITTTHPSSGYETYVSWADVNGDGLVDWVRAASDRTQVRFSNGDGTFSARIDSPHGQSALNDYVSWVDINGDGRADWVRGGAASFRRGYRTGTEPLDR